MNNIKAEISNENFNVRVEKFEAPFDLYKFDCKAMIPNSEAFKLREALLRMHFKKRSCDLYSFSQSLDLNTISTNERPIAVQQFIEVVGEIKEKISTFLGLTFNNAISISCSKYDQGDYLLCHDDRVDNRRVAFIYYLNYDWLSEWGGSLDVYSVDQNYNTIDIVKRINPDFNSFLFFPVGNNTYHQVAENISNFSRISINGWFHCDNFSWTQHAETYVLPKLPLLLPVPISRRNEQFVRMCIEPTYHDPMFRRYIQNHFKEDGYGACGDFFKPIVINGLSDELFSNDLQWEIKGPSNRMNYKVLKMTNLPQNILNLISMLRTKYMFEFFKELTGLDLIGVDIEVQKWHGGHYMASGGNDGFKNMHVFRAYIFFSQSIAKMSITNENHLYYVFQEHSEVLPRFKFTPQNNTIILVNRLKDMEAFNLYCKKVDGHSWTAIVATYLIKDVFECNIHEKLKY